MHVMVFNAALLTAWLLVLVGGVLVHPGWGLVGAGLMLVGLVLACVRIAGGVYAPREQKDKS